MKHLSKNSNKQCHDCKLGEHDNYNYIAGLFIIRDPDGIGRGFVKRCYLCADHYHQYADDGYELIEVSQ